MNRRPRNHAGREQFALMRICCLTIIIGVIIWMCFHPQPCDAAYISKSYNLCDWPAYTVTVTSIGDYYVTGYVPGDIAQCGRADGITASGVPATAGRTVAMKGVPFGTRVYIGGGIGERIVEDRGVGRGVIDVACEDNAACYRITSYMEVWIIE